MADEVKNYRVVAADEPRRILFEGIEKDARAYLEAHFPRTSSDGFSGREVHSAQLVAPDDSVERFHIDKGYGSYDKDADETTYKSESDDLSEPVSAPAVVVDEPVTEPVVASPFVSSPLVGGV